jgi:hypothetical protein
MDSNRRVMDVIGKVFVVTGRDKRHCLTCDGVFTPRGAAEHTETACRPPHDETKASTIYEHGTQKVYLYLWVGSKES